MITDDCTDLEAQTKKSQMRCGLKFTFDSFNAWR